MATYIPGIGWSNSASTPATTFQTTPTVQGKSTAVVAAQMGAPASNDNIAVPVPTVQTSVVSPQVVNPTIQAIVNQVVQQQAQSAAPVQSAEAANQAAANTIRDAAAAVAQKASANITIPDLSYNYNVPNMSWTPTSDQLANWLTLGGQQAETEAAPQRQSLATGMERYTTSAGEAKTAANTQYTNQELALANVVKNTMLKSAEENAIRRGAETSGWLGQQQQDIGRYETEQRAGIKGQANDYFNQLSNSVMAKQQETNDLMTELERVKGLRTNVLANQLQGTERGNVFNEKSADWANQLSQGNAVYQQKNADFANQVTKGSMINAEQAQAAQEQYNNLALQYNRDNQLAQQAYQQQALAAQVEATKWDQSFSEEQFGANQAQQSLQNSLAAASSNRSQPTASTYNWTDPNSGQTFGGLSLAQILSQYNQDANRNANNQAGSKTYVTNPDGSITVKTG